MNLVWFFPKRKYVPYRAEEAVPYTKWNIEGGPYRTLLVYWKPFAAYFAFSPGLRLTLGRPFGWRQFRIGRIENWKWNKLDFNRI